MWKVVKRKCILILFSGTDNKKLRLSDFQGPASKLLNFNKFFCLNGYLLRNCVKNLSILTKKVLILITACFILFNFAMQNFK